MRDYIMIRQKAFYNFLQNYNKNKPKKEQIKLDLKDLVIFEYIAQFCLSDNEKIKSSRIVVGGKEYTHITYKKIIEDNPFLDISSKRHILRMVNKLEKLGLIYKLFLKEKGNKTYFTLGHTGLTLATSMSEALGHTSRNPSDTDVRSLRTSMSDNSNINIDSKNIDNKNKKNIYISALSFFEKNLLRIISNLQDLFEKHYLPAFKEKNYLSTYKKLLSKGYTQEQLLLAIYARVEKTFTEEVSSERKLLETLSNPNYFVKSIDQLIVEANNLIKIKEKLYKKSKEEVFEELEVNFLRHCYLSYEKAIYNGLIIDGYFIDYENVEYHIKEFEYHLYLMKKFLLKYDIKLADIRYFVIANAENIPYEILMKRLLTGLIRLGEEENIELLKLYSTSDEEFTIKDLHNKYLISLQIDKKLDEVVKELESQLEIE